MVEQDPNDPSDDLLGYYPVETRTAIERSGTLAGVYRSNRMQVLGLRYDRASYSKDSDLGPRLNAMYQMAPTSFLRVGWGQYRQIQGIEEVNALDENGNYFASELSEQWTAGFDHHFDSGANFRLERYVKNGSHSRPVFRNWVAGALDVFPETNEDRLLVYPIKSTGKGFEVYYAQDSGRKTSLSGSYAFAFADEKLSRVENVDLPEPILFELPHPGLQDQRHALNLDLTYRPSAAWSMNFSYAYHSGWPTTLAETVSVTRQNVDADVATRPELLYSSRLPAYYRLDARVTRRYATDRGEGRVFFELINMTNRENVFAYDYEKAIDYNGNFYLNQEGETWFPLLPSLGVSWTGGF